MMTLVKRITEKKYKVTQVWTLFSFENPACQCSVYVRLLCKEPIFILSNSVQALITGRCLQHRVAHGSEFFSSCLHHFNTDQTHSENNINCSSSVRVMCLRRGQVELYLAGCLKISGLFLRTWALNMIPLHHPFPVNGFKAESVFITQYQIPLDHSQGFN